MDKPWFKVRTDLQNQIREDLQKNYPDLQIKETEDILYVRGSFPIIHRDETLDRFQIEIKFPPNYPKALPAVYEIGGRIPRTLDRHIMPSTGCACLFVEEEWLADVGREPSFFIFLEGPVRNFFLGQSLVEAGQPWPFGERSHGKSGIIETYGEWFHTKDEAVIMRYLECLSKKKIKGHWDCPCKSGKRIRQCHLNQIQAFRVRIPEWLAQQAFERLNRLNNSTKI